MIYINIFEMELGRSSSHIHCSPLCHSLQCKSNLQLPGNMVGGSFQGLGNSMRSLL